MDASCGAPLEFDFFEDLPPLVSETSNILEEVVCSAWVWCPCDGSEWSACSRESPYSCSMDDVCDDNCTGDGSWSLKCGDQCLGPPCYNGQFYGETAFVCRCPTPLDIPVASESSSSLSAASPESENSCQDAPTMPLFGILPVDYDPEEYVPEIIFETTDGQANTKGVWTWCPCDLEDVEYPIVDEYRVTLSAGATPAAAAGIYTLAGTTVEGRPYYSDGTYYLWGTNCELFGDPDEYPCCEWHIDTIEPGNPGLGTNSWFLVGAECGLDCPLGDYVANGTHTGTATVTTECPFDAPTACADGAGHWIFRGGDQSLGPPPLAGRYYGETLFVGFCCGVSSSLPSLSSSSSSLSEVSSSQSCSMPMFPDFWWAGGEVPQDLDFDFTGADGGEDCAVPAECGGWIWCQCDDDLDSNCSQTFPGDDGTCPWDAPDVPDVNDGWWTLHEGTDHHGPPCIVGRFYGEIIYFCTCPVPVSSSSSSASCVCEPGGLQVAVSNDEDFYFLNGYYNPVGWSNGELYYQGCPPNDNWYIVFTPGGATDDWDIRENPPGDAAGADGFTKTAVLGSEPDPEGGTYNGYGAATGTASVTCCYDCATDCTADPPWPDPITVNISGFVGSCACMNGNWDLARTDCYWDFSVFFWDIDPNWCCISMGAAVTCACGAWQVYINGDTLVSGAQPNCGPENDSPAYISQPQGVGTEPPPKLGWVMTSVGISDCTPGGQIPTVTLSY